MTRLIWHGRIPQVWELPILRRSLADAKRLAPLCPDPRNAKYYRDQVIELTALIEQTEKDAEHDYA